VGSKSQIPLLGNIPAAGLLFGSRTDQTIREEVILLLTVHIIKESTAERDEFRSLIEDVERIRIGSRRGLLETGRERLAQAYYQEAVRRLEGGDRDGALLHVRMALNNQPRHVPALKLRERLLGERMWDDEGTRTRTLIQDLIGHERTPAGETPAPAFGRPDVATMPTSAPADEPAEDPQP
jgi:hypothetical protein